MRIGSYGASSQTYYGAKIVAHTNFTSTANTDLSFDLGGLGEVMRLHSSGTEKRVGIGTTNPQSRLHVAAPDPATNFNLIDFRNPDYGIYAKTNSINARGNTLEFTATDYNISGTAVTRDVLTLRPEGNVGIGTTSPNSLLELDGAIGIGGASGDSNVSISTTAFTAQSAGSLHINWGVSGTAANGSTVVFTYAATSWKSWTLKYNFASTNGITQGVIGGYNNSSSTGGSSVYDINELGCSAVATNSGQTVIVTFTFTALGVHPMTSFVYMQSGSDGQPRADRVSLQANNAV